MFFFKRKSQPALPVVTFPLIGNVVRRLHDANGTAPVTLTAEEAAEMLDYLDWLSFQSRS